MQLKYHMITIEDLVPKGHFLGKLETALDLSFVYEETTHLYSRKYGRPPIGPVVLVKYLLVGFLYGIPSERQIEQRIQTDVALRWYLDLLERVPDHSTISQLPRRKPDFRKVFRRLFEEVVRQCIRSTAAPAGCTWPTWQTRRPARAVLCGQSAWVIIISVVPGNWNTAISLQSGDGIWPGSGTPIFPGPDT